MLKKKQAPRLFLAETLEKTKPATKTATNAIAIAIRMLFLPPYACRIKSKQNSTILAILETTNTIKQHIYSNSPPNNRRYEDGIFYA